MNNVAYTRLDTNLACATDYDPDWRDRFGEAYRRQSRDFLRFVATGDLPAIASNAWDGDCAAVIAEAGARALASEKREPIELIKLPALYGARQEAAA